MAPLYVQDLELLDQKVQDVLGGFNTSANDLSRLCKVLFAKCKVLTTFAEEVEKRGEDLREQLELLPSDEDEISRETWFRRRHGCYQEYFNDIEESHATMATAVNKIN